MARPSVKIKAKASAKVRRLAHGAGAPQSRAPKVGFVSLGCPKALVDSERIITKLRSEGYTIARDYSGADVVVV
ncbi:MAG TPA: 30S ribosomal protein S12 methylthiotransferase RimO, partial [Hyphomicrobium sp.]